MKAEFWHERWETDQLGFHQSRVNPLLVEHWPGLGVASDAPVFVPLCGKSLDMVWLRDQGHPVVGVELSPIAVRDFFRETGLPATRTAHGDLERYTAGGYDLYCGDLFALEPADLEGVTAVYDRASLIALPPDVRERYAEHMIRILPADVSTLLITIDYDQTKMDGPPHSVPVAEIEGLFGGAFAIETLWSSGPIDPTPRFQERGLDAWSEFVLRLERRGTH